MKKTFFLFSLFALFSLVYSPKVGAAEHTLKVSPVIITVTLSPGKTYTKEITIENLSTMPMPLRATLNDFMTSDEEGGYVFEESKTNPLLSWIKLSETEFIINPKEKKTIQMTVTTPKSIQLGGYYGILFFEPVLQNTVQNATKVNSKVGVLLLANVGAPDPNAPKAEIVAFDTPLIDDDGDIPVVLRVKNISLNFFTAKPRIIMTPLMTLNTGQKTEASIEDKIIFPGKIRRWTEESAVSNLSPNIYRAQVEISTGNGQYVTSEKYVIVFPYIIACSLLLGLTFLIFVTAKRKRIRKALIAFFN